MEKYKALEEKHRALELSSAKEMRALTPRMRHLFLKIRLCRGYDLIRLH